MGSVGIDLGLKDSATASKWYKLQIKQRLIMLKILAAQRAKTNSVSKLSIKSKIHGKTIHNLPPN